MEEVLEEVVVDHPPEVVFDFFTQPHRVLGVSDPSVGATLISGPKRLTEGSEVELKLVAFGMPQTIRNRVSEFDAPSRFVEQQADGPLTSYDHEHRFEPSGTGTKVVDAIRFEPPGGLAGLILSGEKIADQLADSIAYRNRALPAALDAFVAEQS